MKNREFTIWAPHAKAVSIVGDFNNWDIHAHFMEQNDLWRISLPLNEGERYKFAVHTPEKVLLKSDPRAHHFELRPGNASIVFDIGRYQWSDQEWMSQRTREINRPMNIYEVHLGSWKQVHHNYRQLAEDLAAYCKEMGYTHVELLPITEHPLDESWGYQVTGFFAPTSRFGTPEDFQFFVDHLHNQGLGVFLDWVPGHFPLDEFGLSHFDGTPLYEHVDPIQRIHPLWTTAIFDYAKSEVVDFLIDSALFWCDKMHIDGLRVDAVSSIIYLDHEREPGAWQPNPYGGKENIDGIAFLKKLNATVKKHHPDVLMIAEESRAFPGVSDSLENGGLGFDMKWNMGWMNDTLAYFSTDHDRRKECHRHLTWGLTYAFSERFILPFSHDEVVHEKRSLLSKMPGDTWQQFAGLRLLYSYKLCQPGKQLLFMGGEFGQLSEWNCKEELPWHLLEEKHHQGIHKLIRDLNQFYLAHPALWECDFDPSGFEWIESSGEVISYKRKSAHETLICVHNFHPTDHPAYALPYKLKELFNTDATIYGGSGRTNPNIKETIAIPPLATLIFSN